MYEFQQSMLILVMNCGRQELSNTYLCITESEKVEFIIRINHLHFGREMFLLLQDDWSICLLETLKKPLKLQIKHIDIDVP